ncbi:MAG: RNA-binding cell elongation regulator Jag/EloR, partial [Thermoleophilia bacterium]|nr:RNA-binding cell elongation regulator Jag/EloR [Thermoleophilia bacterium]
MSVEATGETVGEARWAALQELERRVPWLDRDAVEVTVLSEGERGLLGVGYAPARVRASVRPAAQPTAWRAAEGARGFVERVAAAIGADVRVTASTRSGVVTLTCAGPDVGLLIGRRGQTIDAVQYLANALARAASEPTRIVVDAAGYRARRAAALQATARRAAERALATGRPVELEPMTAVERKIVHEAL